MRSAIGPGAVVSVPQGVHIMSLGGTAQCLIIALGALMSCIGVGGTWLGILIHLPLGVSQTVAVSWKYYVSG